MQPGTKRLPVRTIHFRVVSDRDDDLQPGPLLLDLVESRSRIHRVVVDGRKDIVWDRQGESAKSVEASGPAPAHAKNGANGKGLDCASAIPLTVKEGCTGGHGFVVRVNYSGGPPVVSGIRKGNGANAANGAISKETGDEPAATRIQRRLEAMKILPPDLQEYYRWFTLLEERSDEKVLATQKPAVPAQAKGKSTFDDVSTTITLLRSELQALMGGRMMAAHDQDEKRMCTPKVTPEIATQVLLIHDRVFMAGVGASGVLGNKGKNPGDLSKELTKAFLAFCQGDLRLDNDRVSDLNVEPDGAMMFLFAEYALVLLQAVDETTGPKPKTRLRHPEAQAIADGLIGNPAALQIWKRLAASFILGQHVFMRTYAPSRSIGRPVFEDYARTNFDVNQRLGNSELDGLRRHYEGLRFSRNGRPMDDPSVRDLCAHHASNACEAFPGDLDRFLELPHPKHGSLLAKVSARKVTVFLRSRRGTSQAVRRHVRREVASVLKLPRTVETSSTMGELGIDATRWTHLATMLAAYASVHREKPVLPTELRIDAKTTVEGLAMQLNDLIAS